MSKFEAALVGVKKHPELLTIKEVQKIIGGKSRSTIYRWIEEGSLPRPIKIGANSIAWPEEVLMEWRNSLIKGGA